MAGGQQTRGTPGTPRVLRAMNDRAALDLLVSQGPLTRTRIGELTGLSKPTTSQLLARLAAAGLVRTTGSVTGRPGPSAQLYEIPAAAQVAALSVDGLGVTAAVADITGRLLGEERVSTDAVGTEAPHRTAQLAARAVDGALAKAGLGRDRLHGAVIGTPGALDPQTGRLRYAPHLPGLASHALKEELADALGMPVTVENDVNLAAVAEQYDGAAQGVDDFVLVWVDEGIGAALVLGGRLLRGATGGAGEIGYLPLPGAPLSRGGDRSAARADAGGGLQRLVGAPSVRALGRELGGPEVRTVAGALAHDAVRAMVARRLATGLAAVVAVVDPGLVVLSGAVPQAGGEALRALVEAEFTGLALPRPALRLSSLDGNPILLGALRTALAQAREAVFRTG
ncbi:putative NBD/HSP70 family sugar kinase [Streptomyces sp. 2333.5]|nr:putative NBD/HSP70 family sugar kinase [Streptomyces sp. 2333.5]SEC89711.1 Sugar kinase of the NBD/HSP70 family, may contain an N-terminal HTH domain [Streptomyces sp. 2314.4]SED75094.1 Sugar kinase of the NBD/HSP70 family, may contain an N-terminal HTH domain [Streptomyces sp. 2112.2]